MEAYDAEVEWALMNNIEPADHIAALTRSPQEPVRLSPEQTGCVNGAHPLETLKWNAYFQVMECGECGAWILIEDLEN